MAASFAAAGDSPTLGSLVSDGGAESVSFSLTSAAPARGVVSGSSVTYDGILPGTDVTETATATGISESLTLGSADVATSWVFPLRLKGLTASLSGDSVDLKDASGAVVWVIPPAVARSGPVNMDSGHPQASSQLTYQLVTYDGGTALEMTLARSWLDAAGRVFPVTVDPVFSAYAAGSTYVQQSEGTDEEADNGGSEFLPSGYYYGSSTDYQKDIDFLDFKAEIGNVLTHQHVTAATLELFDVWAYQCTYSEDVNAYQVTQSWAPSGELEYPGPTYTTQDASWTGLATSAECDNTSGEPGMGSWIGLTFNSAGLALLNNWTVNDVSDDYGWAVAPSLTDAQMWKQFDSANDGTVPSDQGGDCSGICEPYLEMTYTADVPPQIDSQYPPDNYNSATLTPELLASGHDLDDWPDSSVEYDFTVYNSSGTSVATSGLIADGDWTVPSGDLSWGQTYYWTVQDYDGLDYSATATTSYFSTPVPQPLITSGLSQNDTGPGFDAASGDWTTSVTDANVTTVGPALEITRDYNSEDPRVAGAFGAGWSSVLDMRVSPGQASASGSTATEVVTYPDGSQVGFGLTASGTYAAPPGRYATLAAVTGGGFTLTDKNDTVYTFTQALPSGAYGITSIADAFGHTETFTWNSSDEITTVTSASGRALTLTWTSTSASGALYPHVASVVTPDVVAGESSTALTWTYSYSGDELTAVCPPTSTTACTAYTYTSGSDYPDAVLDSGPDSYWRLDETSGTTAASSVLANEGTDDATYSSGVSPGSASGPLDGSSATAAAFNGSDGYVTLPQDLVSGAQYQSVSLWFKTTSENDVLFSYSSDAITAGTTTNAYTPTLYVGSDGKLHGEFWTDTGVVPIESSSVVDNDAWYQVTLTAAGDTQTMYLDGAPVASLAGTINVTAEDHDYVGAGFLGGAWPDEADYLKDGNDGYATYFDGDISDVGFWDRPLTSAEVGAMYAAGTRPADLLTQVTRPSGSVYTRVAYNGLTGRASSVTDSNGGTWTINPPAVTGSSQVYASSVLGAEPADYWRLGDSGTTDAVNQVLAGGTAVYNDVTQGVTGGEFSDTTVDSFDGTDSYITLPSGTATAAGDESVSLWFKTTTAGGVLFSTSTDPITDATTADSYTPELYVGTDGYLHGEFWEATTAMKSATAVDNGKWHNVVLTAGTDSEVMYVDGVQAATVSGTLDATSQDYDYIGTGFVGGAWPDEAHSSTTSSTGYANYFTGDIGDVAYYPSELTAAQVTDQWNASQSSSGLTPVQTDTVTDPGGHTLTYTYDALNGDRVLSQTDGRGDTTTYGYDANGFQDEVINPNGDVTQTGYDVRGNMVSETTCQDQTADDCSTGYYTYYPNDTSTTLTPDPRNDMLLTYQDPRSSSDTDTTYETTYTYDTSGDVTAVTTPPVPGSTDGQTTSYAYTNGTTDVGGYDDAIPPKGLPYQETTPGGAVTSTYYLADGDVAEVIDPDGLETFYGYDGLGQVTTETVYSDSYPDGLTTTYAYNGDGQVTSETDPPVTNRVTGAIHTAQTATTYDADGDVLSQTAADTTGGDASRTVTDTYNSNDLLASQTDAAGAETTYTYNAYGDLASETDPDGNVTDYSYDADGNLTSTVLENYTGSPSGSQAAAPLTESSRAYDPAGRLASVTDSMGFVTSYGYTDNGLLATVTRYPDMADAEEGTDGYVEESDTYDGAGNLTAQVTDNGGTTTDDTVDAGDQTTEEVLDPSGLDRTTSISYTYDPGGNMTSESVADPGAGGPSAWFPLTQTSGTTVPDSVSGGPTATAPSGTDWTGSAASFSGTSGQQITTSGPVLDTTGSFTVSAWVDLASDSSQQTAVSQTAGTDSGFYLKYDSGDEHWEFMRPETDTTSPSTATATSTSDASTGTWTLLTGTYNANTSRMTLYVNGTASGTTTDSTPIASHGPLTIGGAKWNSEAADFFDGQIADVQVYPGALSASQISTLYGDGKGGSDVTTGELTTAWTLDERGLPTSMTDPDGNTTYYSYDEAGRLAVTTDPSVPVETYTAAGGDSVVNADPETTTGYDTFGDTTESEDADGNVTTYGYDGDGREVSEALPSYTPPGSSSAITATYTKTYNGLGQVTSATDGAGNTTSYGYDQLGDLTSETAPDNGATSYTYDTNGDQLSATSPTGSETTATYDYLGRQLTSTQVERYTAAGTTADYTTTDAYASSSTDPGGSWLSSETSPDGSVTQYGYDAAGEETSVTDGAGNTTSYGYDDLGRQTAVTNPDGTATDTAYDAAGNVTSVSDLSSGADVLRTESATYDGDGDELSATDFDGDTTSYTYDPTGMLTAEVQPVTASSGITTSFGYDAAGNMTRYTDGDGNNWYYTYNSWGQQGSKVEPATSTYTSPADSTDTWAYDADGRPVTETEPGGVTVTDGYNDMSELTSQAGSGASATTADRTFGYDEDGNLTSATTSNTSTTDASNATSESYTYNDRDELLTSSGSAGSSSYAYDGDDRLATVDDPATGTTSTYTYYADSQVKEISYGSDAQDYDYNDLHELTSDTLETSSGATVASIGYEYDPDGQITSMDTTGLAGAADNTYTYDESGRLTSWDNGTTTTGYGYDNDGNLTTDGSKTYTYDARDELTSDGTDTYNYTANGDLASEVTPDATETSTFDAYGDQVTSGTQSLSYDALGRVLTDDGSSSSTGYTFSYEGSSGTLASDGTSTYTWDPTGTSLVGVGISGGTSSQGVLALTDQHSDVLADFTSGGTSVSGSTAYDPWGDVTATNGTVSGQVGYQSEWTDPVTGKVSMGSRWYTPGTGDFTSADTAQVSAVPDSTAANPFAYAGDDPVSAADPTGHMPIMIRGPSGAGSLASYSHYTAPPSPIPPGTITTPARAEIDYDRSQASYYAQQASSWSKPKQASCPWYDLLCDAEKVYHQALDLYHKAMDYAAHYADLVKALTARLAKTGVRDLDTAVSDAAKWGAHAAAATWQAAASVTARVYHTVTRYGSDVVHAAEHVVSTAWHAVHRAATATVNFVKHHAAAIASIVTSVAVFAGCEATLGAVTAGAASEVCGGLAGAAGSAVGYVVTAEEHHDFSWSGLGEAALEGGIAGVAGGFLGEAVGGLVGVLGFGAADRASALAEGAMAEGGADGAADAAGETSAEADGAADSSGSGSSGSADDPEQAQEAGASGVSENDSVGPSCGGESFAAGTLVLLANGKTEAISKLKVGQKVLAMNPKTGKDQVETVTAVLVHHDTDLYDLKIRTDKRTAVIDTTSNHLFWVPGTGADGGRWVKAGSLKYGSHLRTPGGADTATVAGGWVPAQRDGWMWDLTVPGNNDHDFYIGAIDTDVLVHNANQQCPVSGYRSFPAAKRALGSPGQGNVFDHVVEQSQIGRSGFDPDEIHNPFNMDPVTSGINQAKANYYSSIRSFTNGVTVRNWLTGQSFADQYNFGMDILARLQSGRPLP